MQCTSCGRHQFEVAKETDKKGKKWVIRRCAICKHPNDLLPARNWPITLEDFDAPYNQPDTKDG